MVALFLVLALLLVAFGGLLAAADSALGTLSRAQIQELAVGSRARRPMLAIAADAGAHANAINFLRILAETTAAVLVTLAAASLIRSPWLVLLTAAVVMTGVSFVLVGASPRSVGRVHARGVLRASAHIVRGTRLLLGPIANLLVWLGNVVTPGRPRRATFTSEEQLLSMVDEATELDVLEHGDRDLIHSIFEWGDTVVREVMVPRTDMTTIEATATADTAMRLFFSSGLSRVPVTEKDADEILGVLHLRDVARALNEQRKAKGSGIAGLVRAPLFIPDSKKADATLRQMQQESNHLAMVVDEYGGIAGLVTLEDLIEELVGDISDEYDRDQHEIESLDDGVYRVRARLSLDELGDLFDLQIDDEDVDTVGGLLTKAAGRLPQPGSVVRTAGLILTADRTEGRRRGLTSVLVQLDPEVPREEYDDAAVRSVGA
ncbi:hemolysin family protein [uncultured Amnibacterium sp.]|uniref:hemolysin family protein n=1 Tax=uncultured Amnibacterium sp. TaxID=1631851 RepID=UPI0035CB2A44